MAGFPCERRPGGFESVHGQREDALILALEQELAAFDSSSDDDKAARKAAEAARKEAKAARKEAKAARKEAKATRAECSSDAAAAGSADASTVTAPLATAGMFSVHAGETVHFSGRKPGDPKPISAAQRSARVRPLKPKTQLRRRHRDGAVCSAASR